MSSRHHLTDQEFDDVEFEHRHATDKRYADRVRVVYLPGKGWSVTKIAGTLLIDRGTVRNHFKHYRKGSLAALQRNDAIAREGRINTVCLRTEHYTHHARLRRSTSAARVAASTGTVSTTPTLK